jgi:hypothetical protein
MTTYETAAPGDGKPRALPFDTSMAHQPRMYELRDRHPCLSNSGTLVLELEVAKWLLVYLLSKLTSRPTR